jgi:hypothetical protein
MTKTAKYPDWSARNLDPGVMNTGLQIEFRRADFPAMVDFRKVELEGSLRNSESVARGIPFSWLVR